MRPNILSSEGGRAPRYVALWVPDWPLASLVVDVPPGAPAATIDAGKVLVATPAARVCGVRLGMTRLQAQYKCPDLLLYPLDLDRQNAVFETVLEVFDQVAAGVVAVRPGLAFAPARSASRWMGGEERLMRELVDEVAAVTGAESQVGIASGLAASFAAARQNLLVAPDATERFLADMPLAALSGDFAVSGQDPFASTLQTLRSLGVITVSQLLALGRSAVASRFGAPGVRLWQLATGTDLLAPVTDRQEATVLASLDLDPPATQIEYAVTAASRASVDLANRMEDKGLHASSVAIELQRVDGRVHRRTWTMVDARSSLQVSKRALWQLQAWADGVTAAVPDNEDSALQRIEVSALHVKDSPDWEPLWGGKHRQRQVGKTLQEVQSVLGPAAVVTPELQGGFDPRTRVALTPWGQGAHLVTRSGPWQGAVTESPLLLYSLPPSILLLGTKLDGSLGPIWVTGRGMLTGTPETMVVREDRPGLGAGTYALGEVVGVWMVLGRWWRPRNAGLQNSSGKQTDLQDAEGLDPNESRCFLRVRAREFPDLLLVQRGGTWWVEGLYVQQAVSWNMGRRS